MTDDAHGYQDSRTTRTRWSVFEPMGQEEVYDDVPEGDGNDSGVGGSGADDTPLDPLLVAVAGELRRPVELGPELDGRVMALVAAEPRPERDVSFAARPGAAGRLAARHGPTSAVARAWRWLSRPRLVQLSPLGGLAFASGLAALLLVALRSGTDTVQATSAPAAAASPVAAAAPVADSVQVIQFVLVAPDARTVALVGDFNDWQADATPMRAAASGRVWSVQVPLSAGRHRYAFVVDGERWVPDPSAPRAPGDDFGTPNSVVTVTERRS